MCTDGYGMDGWVWHGYGHGMCTDKYGMKVKAGTVFAGAHLHVHSMISTFGEAPSKLCCLLSRVLPGAS